MQNSVPQQNTFWEEHPFWASLTKHVQEGKWVTHLFEWLFMYISRFAAYAMTFAVGYIILYAIESGHGMDVVVKNPNWIDTLAVVSNQLINVAPELVFPGVVVLCIRSLTARKWIDFWAWLVTSVIFVILTMTLLNAFMNDGINKEFLASMLFWRAGAALWYTVVVAYCGGGEGLDFKTLLKELGELREQLDAKNQEVDGVQSRLKSVQSQVSTLQNDLSTGQKLVSSLRVQLEDEQKKVSSLGAQLDSGQGETGQVVRELNAAKIQMDTLKLQMDAKTQEVEELKKMLSSGQDWKVDGLTKQLQTERERVSSLEKALEAEQKKVSSLRVQLDSAQSSTIHHPPSTSLSSGQRKPSTSQQLDTPTGYPNVVQLDASRAKKSIQRDQIEDAIRQLLQEKPGLSGQKIAAELGCSPTTASNWKKKIEEEQQPGQVING